MTAEQRADFQRLVQVHTSTEGAAGRVDWHAIADDLQLMAPGIMQRLLPGGRASETVPDTPVTMPATFSVCPQAYMLLGGDGLRPPSPRVAGG